MIAYTLKVEWKQVYKGKTKHYKDGTVFITSNSRHDAIKKAVDEFWDVILMPGETRELISIK